MKIDGYLEQLNLSKKERDAYLALLEIGESHIVPIAKKVNSPRTSVAYTLEKLRAHSLIEIVQRNSRKIYIPLAPRKIGTLLKNKKSKLEEQINAFELSLPELNRIYGIHPFDPKVRFFRGRDEIRQMYDEILNEPINEVTYVGENAKIAEMLGENFLKHWIKRRVSKKIWSKAVRVKSQELEEPIFQPSLETMRKVRYPPENFVSPAHIMIYGDHVAILTTAKESIGVVITSRDFARSMRSWFSELWKVSTEPKILAAPLRGD